MTERTQISTTIDPVIKAMLYRMCVTDLRTLREQLEHLITQEHQRRQAPHHKLTDEPVEYRTEKEIM